VAWAQHHQRTGQPDTTGALHCRRFRQPWPCYPAKHDELQLLADAFNKLLDGLALRESKLMEFTISMEQQSLELAMALTEAEEATKAKSAFWPP